MRPYAFLHGGAVGAASPEYRRRGTSCRSLGGGAGWLGLGRHFRVSGERFLAEKRKSAGAMERVRSGKVAAGGGVAAGEFGRRLELETKI